MNTTVDARGLSCPQPVMLVKKAITEGRFPIEVLVSTATVRDNVLRTAQRAGVQATVQETGGYFSVLLQR